MSCPRSVSLTDLLNGLQNLQNREGRKATLLAINPMSRFIVRSTLEAAQEYQFPVMLIATRNQVETRELGGGYILGWDQEQFVAEIRDFCHQIGFRGPLFICRDHGGPWLRDHEYQENLPEKEAMERAKASFLADIRAGFNVLHVDCTVDPHFEGYVPLKIVTKRTVEIIEYIEKRRKKEGLGKIGYEAGAEKTAGGLTDFRAFEEFLKSLIQELDERNLPRPDFIVGQTGTLIKMQKNVGDFNPDTAQRLAAITRKYGVGFKEHNADFLDDEILKLHPDLGITAANTGPEFSTIEIKAYLKLGDREKEAVKQGRLRSPSNFLSVLGKRALESERWRKWLEKNQTHLTRDDVAKDPQILDDVTVVSGRYVMDEELVRREKAKLLQNLENLKIVADPERAIIESIKKSTLRWIEAFNLKNLNVRTN